MYKGLFGGGVGDGPLLPHYEGKKTLEVPGLDYI
jgi:hypothetical protein